MSNICNKYPIQIEKIIDGDTIDCVIDLGFDIHIKKRIRLLGIDTPESRTKNIEEKKYGILSKEKLNEILQKSSSTKLSCQENSRYDKFGRVLGEIWVTIEGEEINVNKWMCDNGYAVSYQKQNKNEIKHLHEINRNKISIGD